jgi:DNA invertase Pin-like site-specific DNA recombinase
MAVVSGHAGGAAPLRAAEYVRMSTDHQKYSIENQSEANRIYAAVRGIEIVRTYADRGISGLGFEKRDALKRLIADVESGGADFEAILVYDVSRWGRFQDSDESGYYEYVCKRAGVKVHYCAEPFENDGSPFSAIVKSIKRAMAGEYSRELSVKTFAAKSRIVGLGYRVGGQPGYGLRRMVINEKGVPRGQLARGEWKVVSTDRVVLVPGPQEEVDIVCWIFSTFVRRRKTEFEIANILNGRGITNDLGRPWNRHAIKRILRSEKYIGNNVWNRTSFKLQKTLVNNGPDAWLRAEGAFEPIIGKSLFEAAQAMYCNRVAHPITGRAQRYSDDEMLQRLRRLLRRRGYVSKSLINKSRGIQSGSAYEARFGSLTQAYQRIGFTAVNRKRRRIRHQRSRGLSDKEMLEKLRGLLRERGNLSHSIVAESSTVPSRTAYESRFGSLRRAYQLIGFRPDPYRKHSPRPHGLSDDELLDALRALLRKCGHLSETIICKDKSAPSYHTYQKRFGGLRPAYTMIGYTQKRRGCGDQSGF